MSTPDEVLAAIAVIRPWLEAIPNPHASKRLEQVRAADLQRLLEWQLVACGQMRVGERGRHLGVAR